jgi:hypothetical protein
VREEAHEEKEPSDSLLGTIYEGDGSEPIQVPGLPHPLPIAEEDEVPHMAISAFINGQVEVEEEDVEEEDEIPPMTVAEFINSPIGWEPVEPPLRVPQEFNRVQLVV